MKYLLYGFLILFGSISVYFLGIKPDIMEAKYSKKYFEKLKLELKGVVTEKKIFTNDAGLLFVDVRQTNINNYDIRNGNNMYYCIIKNGKAELIEGGLSLIEIGDSICVSSKESTFSAYRAGKLIESHLLYVRQFGALISKVKKNHKL